MNYIFKIYNLYIVKNMFLNSSLFSKLPFDIIREILLYDRRFVIRNKRIIYINKIPKEDFRFTLYDNISKIYQLSNNSWSVILGKNKRYVIRHYLRVNLVWEYSFIIFSKDLHTNMMCTTPDSIIYIK